ncbi:MAG: CBS domain-containing protein [Anaerolineae bacterium]
MSQSFSLFTWMQRDWTLTIIHELIHELPVARAMTKDVYTLTPDATMRTVKDAMRTHRISGIPILDKEALVGIVSIEDLIRALEQQALDMPVQAFMTTELVTARDQEPLMEALKRLESTGLGRLVVVDESGALVGILTKGDIVAALLTALEEAYSQIEDMQQSQVSGHFFEALESDATSLILRYRVNPRDFASGGQASASLKRTLQQIGASPQLARRVAIATYEAEMNLIIHADNGGHIVAEIRPERITVVAHDDGPGIADVELARQPGYSTATESVREMGFGAGMGLTNIERCTDEMDMWSAPGVGTRLEMVFNVTRSETGEA